MTMMKFRPGKGDSPMDVQTDQPLPVVNVGDRDVVTVILPQKAPGTSSAMLLCAANPLRKSVKITNTTGTQVVWIGTDQNVTATTGDYLGASAGSNNIYYGKSALWGLSVTAAQTLAITEDRYSA